MLSKRLNSIHPSATLGITKAAADLRRQGIDVIGLSQGEPDFPTPIHICEAAKNAIDAGVTRYTDVDGTKELKSAIVRKFWRDNGLTFSESQISVGTGGKQVIFNALIATIDPGDEVIIPAPYWVSYPDMVRLAGATPVEVFCPESQDFKISVEQLRQAITPKTKWLILNSPSNPTGACYTSEELRAIGKELLKHPHVLVMTDDIYEHIRYEGWKFSTMASELPELTNRILTVNGMSKAFSMTGWRIGFGAGPEKLVHAMAVIQGQSTSNPCSVSQAAAIAALDGPMDFLKPRNETFQLRRDKALSILTIIQGITCRKPEGAFYLFPSCKGLIGKKTRSGKVIENDVEFCQYIFDAARVAVVPGSAFGAPGYFRISFATSDERLEEGCIRIANASEELI